PPVWCTSSRAGSRGRAAPTPPPRLRCLAERAMPEGDTIHAAARRIREVLLGRAARGVLAPHPRVRPERLPERLRGRVLQAVDVHGKHMFLRFEGQLTLHSHLRMTGAWGVHGTGQR